MNELEGVFGYRGLVDFVLAGRRVSVIQEEYDRALCGLTRSEIIACIFAQEQLFPERVQHMRSMPERRCKREVWPKRNQVEGLVRGRISRYHLRISPSGKCVRWGYRAWSESILGFRSGVGAVLSRSLEAWAQCSFWWFYGTPSRELFAAQQHMVRVGGV